MKTQLSREQMKNLAQFIQKRGFNEVDVQLEILDHFACKVEEILAKNLSLEFDEAMRQAHVSFGIMGFSVIADSYKNWLKKSLAIKLKREFISFTTFSKRIGFFVAYVALYLLILKVANADFLWVAMMSVVAGIVIPVVSALLTYRPLSRFFCYL